MPASSQGRDGTRKSARTPTASEKRKASDQGSEEHMKKKMKHLEDQIAKLTGANEALSDTVRAMRKKKGAIRRDADNDRGASDDNDGDGDDDTDNNGDIDSDSDSDDNGDNSSPMLYNARKITVTSRSDPDVARLGKKKRTEKGQVQPGVIQPNNAIPQTPVEPECTTHPSSAHPSESGSNDLAPSAGSPRDANPGSSNAVQLPPLPWPPAPFAPGVDPAAPKTANRAYDTVVARMLAEAEHRFECLLFTENAYPDIDKQIQWSMECWEAVCIKFKRYYDLSREMMNLIKARCPHGRGAILLRVRPVIDKQFKMSGNPAIINENSALANTLLYHNTFYYVDNVEGRRRFESETMLRALQSAFYSGPRSVAAKNQLKFDPIPLPSIALVCTVIEHCLREWRSGKWTHANLDETADGQRYRTHLENHEKWKRIDDAKTSLVLKHITRKLFDSCGIKLKQVETTGSVLPDTLEQERAELRSWRHYDTESEV